MSLLKLIDSLLATFDGVNDTMPRPSVCYKFWTIREWEKRQSAEYIWGSDFDVKDGFIHMCTLDQCQMIAKRFFSDRNMFVIIKMDINRLDNVQWDTGEGSCPDDMNTSFPHAYSDIPRGAILGVFIVGNAKKFDFSIL